MAIENPVCTGIISRLSDPIANNAAFLVMMGLTIWIESPVIDLLSTATTLAQDRQSYFAVRSFSIWMIAWVTLAHSIVALSPAYGWVMVNVIRCPQQISQVAHTAFVIMIPWSGLIGWRRHLQGLLIRHGETKSIGVGTAIRLGTIILVGGLLYIRGNHSGVETAALALVCSVAVEAAYIQIVSAPLVRQLSVQMESSPSPLSNRRLWAFHIPLTASTMVTLIGPLLISAALGRLPLPAASMAAWQVALSLLLVVRMVTYALPEVVIALYDSRESARTLRRFCVKVGVIASVMLAALYLFNADILFFQKIIGVSEATAEAAHKAIGASVLIPLLNALACLSRGLLTAHHKTVPRLTAIAVSTVCLFVSLGVGVYLKVPGVYLAGLSLSIAQIGELLVLRMTWGKVKQTGELPIANRPILRNIDDEIANLGQEEQSKKV